MKLLVVDDDASMRDVVKEIFEEDGYIVHCVASGEEALKYLRSQPTELVLSDIRMAQLDGMKFLLLAREEQIPSVIVLMTAFGSIDTAIEAIKLGAFDYISKPFRIDELKAVIARAQEHHAAIFGKNRAAPVSAPTGAPQRTLIGRSSEMVDVYKTAGRAALSDGNVLVLGESGTGKELVAQMIHENSSRAAGPFVPVNCGALTETLLESELFGHVKGAFTGAGANRRGLLETASSGTIFLDEVGDMPLSLQVKLLRALQEGEIRPVGSDQTRSVNLRVIAATHRDLDAAIRDGSFREDLYYRLRVLEVRLPALRDRKRDLPELVQHFLARHSVAAKPISHVSDEAMQLIERYPWPGNIRELENAIESAIAMARTTVLHPEDFPAELRGPRTEAAPANLGQRSSEEIDREHILAVLRQTKFNKVEAAKILGIGRVTLYRKAKKYRIPLDGE